MDKAQKAVRCFDDGNSCSQAVFSTYTAEFGLDYETSLKIACPFGGGMGRMGETCGAVTGAFMVIGLKYGGVNPDDKISRDKTTALVNEFANQFKQRNGTLLCHELLDFEKGDLNGLDSAKEKGLASTVCPGLVKHAVEILEKIL